MRSTRRSKFTRSRRLPVWLGTLFVLFAACVPGGSTMPSVTPSRTLTLEGQDGRGSKDGPFRVVFSGPEGEAATGAEISVVFSRPLRALSLAGDEAAPPLELTPNIEGRWQWVGTHALTFVPAKGRLPGATSIAVEVPASTRSLDGQTLGTAHRFELETPRPRVVKSSPHNGAKGLEPKTTLELFFNQPVDPDVVRRASRLTLTSAKPSRELAFRVERADPKMPKRLTVHPAAPLPIHSAFTFRVSETLVGEEGPLPAGEGHAVAFETYGPLRVERVTCNRETPHGNCAPGSGLGFELSNPVKLKDFKRAVAITPAAGVTWDSWRDDNDLTSYAGVAAKFKAGASYTLQIAGNLTDKYGQKLGKAHVEQIPIDDLWPTVEIGVSGDVLEPALARPITVGSVNVDTFELLTAPLAPADLPALHERLGIEHRLGALRKLAKARDVKPRAGKNILAKEQVSPNQVLPGAHRGPMAIGTRWVEREGSGKAWRRDERIGQDVRVVQVTDLAISAKLSRHGSIVWVTRLSNGAPVPQAKVELHRTGEKPKTYEADVRGVATIPAADFKPDFYRDDPDTHAVIVAKSGDDWAYRFASDYVDSYRYGVPSDLSGRQKRYGMMFTERGLYRPGDTVQLKGIVRAEIPSGNQIPTGLALALVLRSPDGEEVSRQSVSTSRFGTFSAKVKVPKTGALGRWSLSAIHGQKKDAGAEDDESERSIDEGFEVAEYRPAEFKVTAESDKPEYVRGDEARWTAHGDYLFGAPMGKAAVRFTINRSPTWFTPPNSEDFVTSGSAYFADDEETSPTAAQLRSESGKLDEKGQLKTGLRLEMPAQRQPEVVSFDAEVTDISRQALGGSTSAIVHPGTFYVGIKYLDDYFVTAPGDLGPKIIALSPKGERLAGKKVELSLVQRKWTLARQDAGGGAYHSVSKPVDKVVSRCEVTTAAGPASCKLSLTEGGYYLIRAQSKDERGNPVQSVQSFFGIGPGVASWKDSDKLALDLALNKKEYKVGDVARVLIKSPFQNADALVTVARAGVYRTERVKLAGPTPTVVVPVTDDLRPNAFVSVHLVRGRSKAAPTDKDKADVGAPQYRAGYAEIRVDPEARRLKVDVTPARKDLKPGDTAEVEVKVRDGAGKPKSAEVTLYAVDEGVLSLIGYKTPDPLPVFTASRPLQVATVESRESLAKLGLDLGGLLGLEKGQEGGGGGEGTSARRDFRQSAYFNPTLMTDAKGLAKVSFKIPESLTTYRLMAVATSVDDRYGYGESRVVTSRKLMARPALPRFMRTGDSLDAGVVITAKAFGPANVRVKASVSGLELVGSPERTVKLERDSSVEVRFPMLAKSSGEARLRFDVGGEGEHDAVEVRREVKIPTVMEAVALYGETEGASGEQLGDISAIRRDVGELKLSVASTALVGLDAGMEQLVEYPYGCTEQLSSRLLPLVPLRELANDFRFELPKNTNAIVEKTVADILSRQRPDGGFGMWPDSPESSPWVSSYALWVLTLAKQKGASVPARAIEQGRAYVRRYLEQIREDDLWLATAAFIVDVLAEAGAPDAGYMSRLYDKRKKLPLFGQALLLHAMAISKQKSEMLSQLEKEIEGQLRIDANAAYANENLGDDYAVLMDSPARTSALVLRALMVSKPNHALGSKLARGLLGARRGGNWRSTQEAAFALLALDLYRRAQENVVPDYVAKVWMSGTELMKQEIHGKNLSVFEKEIATGKLGSKSTLVFEKQGAGKLFYEARLKYARRTLPSQPLDRGFFIQKTLRPVTPDGLPDAIKSIPEIGSDKFQGGDLVIADIVIVTPSPREFVVIDDPLPAGLEAVDANLSTTVSWLKVAHSGGEPGSSDCWGCDDPGWEDELAHGRAFLQSWYRRELRDDRVLFFVDHMAAGMYHYRYLARATTLGKFIVPPAKAEEMYSPEVFGRTAAVSVEVK